MTTGRCIRRMWLRGTECGGVLGFLYGLLMFSHANGAHDLAIFPLIGGVFGLLLGVLIGAADGLVTGIVLAAWTCVIAPQARHTAMDRSSSALVAVISTMLFTQAFVEWTNNATAIILIASIMAGFFAWRLPAAPEPSEERIPLASAVLFYIEK